MAGEIKSIPIERLADTESRTARLARRIEERSRSAQLVQSQLTRLARTQGDVPGDPNDSSYPAQVDGKGARVPIVFLDTVYDSSAADPVILVPRSATPQAWLYSPFGWIPRLIDLEIKFQTGYNQTGIWVVSFVPELEVEWVDETAAGASGTVKIVRHGAANDQQFEAWFDHMAGSNTAFVGHDAIVKLREGRKLWATPNKEC